MSSSVATTQPSQQNTTKSDNTVSDNTVAGGNQFYFAAWRWHFYAGLYVVPFLLVLAITGLIMVYFNSVETRFGEKHFVSATQTPLSIVQQANIAQDVFPQGTLTQYIQPPTADRASLFTIKNDGKSMMVAVDPYRGTVLDTVERDSTWFYFASDIHGTLLIGDLGDRLLEIAAGLTIILIVTGLYLWWPRNKKTLLRALWPNLRTRGRLFWKELHTSVGFYLSIVLLFFLLSGLAWAGIWGGQFVQAWNTFPAEKWDNVPLSDATHAAMNHGALHEVPWTLEQTPMPASGSDSGVRGIPANTPVNLNSIVPLAKTLGFDEQFRVNLPSGETGVYTISADSMDGDTNDPMGDRTVHIDQYTGKVLAEVGFTDYSVVAKSMAVGIALHQGDMGLWNIIANALICFAVIFLCVSGVVMWWIRRPAGALRLAAPPLPIALPFWKNAVFIGLLLSLAFPLVGITLLIVLTLDVLIFSNAPALKRVVS